MPEEHKRAERKNYVMAVIMVQQLGGRECRASASEFPVEVTALGSSPSGAHQALAAKVKDLVLNSAAIQITSLSVREVMNANIGGFSTPSYYLILDISADEDGRLESALRFLVDVCAAAQIG
jgi:hypothetical protein